MIEAVDTKLVLRGKQVSHEKGPRRDDGNGPECHKACAMAAAVRLS